MVDKQFTRLVAPHRSRNGPLMNNLIRMPNEDEKEEANSRKPLETHIRDDYRESPVLPSYRSECYFRKAKIGPELVYKRNLSLCFLFLIRGISLLKNR